MTILFNILAALWQSQIGRMAIIAMIAGAVGYHNGYQKGDEGRLKLKAQYEEATRKLLTDEAARNRAIVAKSSEEAASHEMEMAEKDKLLEEANQEIEKLEAGNKECGVVSRATVRKLNASR
jgi:uncharacterized protein HemX